MAEVSWHGVAEHQMTLDNEHKGREEYELEPKQYPAYKET